MNKESDILKPLKELKDNSPYKVPEGYFDTLHDRIKENVRQNSLPKRAKIIQMIKPWMSLAAGFLFLIIIYVTFIPDKTNTQLATSSTVVSEDYLETLDPIASQLSEYDLAMYLSAEDINNASIDPAIQTDISDFTIEDIEDLILF
jgi:hypothetical protein